MNHSEFDDFVRSFIGLQFSMLWRGDYTALYAEVGPLSHTYARSGRPRAARNIYFGWDWRVESQRAIFFGSRSSKRRITHSLNSLQGLVIEDISICGRLPELCVRLSGGLWISTFATDESQPEWTVTFPDRYCLSVRRGTVIYADATRPIPK